MFSARMVLGVRGMTILPWVVLICSSAFVLSVQSLSDNDEPTFVDENTTLLQHDAMLIGFGCSHGPGDAGNPFERDIKSAIESNRAVLSEVPKWIEESDWTSSFFKYGLPDHAFPKINLQIGDAPTIADFLAFAVKHVTKEVPVNYLEVGVSVGKTLYQVTRALGGTSGSIHAFDAESINPTFSKLLSHKEPIRTKRWPLEHGSLPIVRRSDGHMDVYKDAGGLGIDLTYLAGDVHDQASWRNLHGKKFNVIYSDALHEPYGVWNEFIEMNKNDLFDDSNGFAIFWDDLHASPEVRQVFEKICASLQSKYLGSACQIGRLNGWVGEHEEAHDIGLFATEELFDLHCALKTIAMPPAH